MPRKTAKPHIGLNGTLCQCTPWRLKKVRRHTPVACRCHGYGHEHCPDAQACLGDCGRKTTPSHTNMPGYCPHCAADARWIKVMPAPAPLYTGLTDQ